MKEFGTHDQFAERNLEQLVLVKELIQDAGVEMVRARALTAGSEALDISEWRRAQRLAHGLAGRAQALNLGVLARCLQELERFAGFVVSSDPQDQLAALQGAAI